MREKERILTQIIYEEIQNNSKVTEKELAKKYFYSERTIRRYFKILKEQGKIKLINTGNRKIWQLLE